MFLIIAYDNNSVSSIGMSTPTNPVIVDTISNGDGGMNLDCPIGLDFTGNYEWEIDFGIELDY